MLNGYPTTIGPLVSGDSKYQIPFTCQNASGTVIDLTTATLTFEMQLDSDTVVHTSGSMVVVSAVAGTCYYAPAATDFPVAGTYNCQIKIAYTSGEQITLPQITITVVPAVPI